MAGTDKTLNWSPRNLQALVDHLSLISLRQQQMNMIDSMLGINCYWSH